MISFDTSTNFEIVFGSGVDFTHSLWQSGASWKIWDLAADLSGGDSLSGHTFQLMLDSSTASGIAP